MFKALVVGHLFAAAFAKPPQAPPPPCPGCVPVFYPGLNDSKCFRIPTIIKTHKGTLLAFSENRIGSCGDNGAHHDLVLRRSSDNGNSWGPMSIVRLGTVPCPGCPAAISNPNPVEVTFTNGSKAVLLHYDTMNNPNEQHHGLYMQMWSYDDGLSWSQSSVLAYPPVNNTGALIGPSDFGATWASSNKLSGLGECSIAFLVSPADGRIIMNCRTGQHHRAQLVWSADGIPGPVSYPSGLVDPGCQGSIVNSAGVLFTSNANITTSRTHMAVKASHDRGASWSSGLSVWHGPSAYSQLVPLDLQDSNKLGLLFEAGTASAYDTISFVAVDYH
eukprot:gene4153-4475_t